MSALIIEVTAINRKARKENAFGDLSAGLCCRIAALVMILSGCSNDDLEGRDEGDSRPERVEVRVSGGSRFVEGSAASERFIGTSLSDAIYGVGGNDEFIGAGGPDVLVGGPDDDTYVFRPGEGEDVIHDDGGAADEIRFEGGISMDELSITEDSVGLVIALGMNDAASSVTVAEWGLQSNYVEYLVVNGTRIDHREVEHMIVGNRRPRLMHSLADQTVIVGEVFQYRLPDGVFVDPDSGDTLKLIEYVPGSGPLPAWLTFDPEAAVFSAAPSPHDVGSVVIEVHALDPGNRKAIGSFRVTVSAAEPQE